MNDSFYNLQMTITRHLIFFSPIFFVFLQKKRRECLFPPSPSPFIYEIHSSWLIIQTYGALHAMMSTGSTIPNPTPIPNPNSNHDPKPNLNPTRNPIPKPNQTPP